VKTTEF